MLLRRIAIYIATGITVLFALLLMTSTDANAWQLIELNELQLNYKRFMPNGRNMLIYPDPPKEALNLGINLDVAHYFYWDSVVESLTNDGQYKSVGLASKIGVRLTPAFSVQYEHHSQHVLDGTHSYMWKYPVEDSVGIVYRFYFSTESRKSIF